MDKIPNLYVLDRFEKAIGVLNPSLPNSCPFFDDLRTERIEYAYLTFEFSVPADHPQAQNLVVGNKIVYPLKNGQFNLFRIINTEDDHNDGQYIKKITSENSAVGDLLGNIILPTTLNSYTLQQALSYLLQGTNWQVGDVELSTTQNLQFDDVVTSLDALHQVMDQFGAQIEFVVQFSGLQVVNRLVHARLSRGRTLNKPFVYGLNLKGVKRTEGNSPLVTALYGIGTKDSNGNLLTFETYNPTLSYPYEKPAGAKWVGDQDALQQWSPDGKHIFGVYKDDKATNPVELFNNTLEELKKRTKPALTYEVDVALLPEDDVQLYDYIIVKDATFQPELVLEAQIVETKTSLTDPSKNQVTLGDYRPIQITGTDRIDQIKKQISETLTIAKGAAGTGLHVVANSPKPEVDGYYSSDPGYLEIEVTENVHLGSVSVFTFDENTTGTVKVQDGNGNDLKVIPVTLPVEGENIISIDYLLRKDVGSYRLYGEFDKEVFYSVSPINYPFDSGSFKVVGSFTDGWDIFYNIYIGGPGIKGSYGQDLVLDQVNSFVQYANGEAQIVADSNQIALGTVIAGKVIAPNVVTLGTSDDVTYYVNPQSGSDENDGLTSATAFASVDKVLSITDRAFDGDITINILNDVYDDIVIIGYQGSGSFNFQFNNNVITGTFKVQSCSVRVNVYDAIIKRKAGEVTAVAQIYTSNYVYFSNCTFIGVRDLNNTANATSATVAVYDNSFCYFYQCQMYGANRENIRASYGGRAMVHDCTGGNSSYGVFAEYAGFVGVRGTVPNASSPQNSQYGGQVVGVTSGNNGTTPSNPTTTYTSSWNSTEGNTWSMKYNLWRNTGEVKQGQWSTYGNNIGCWFFNNGPSSTVTGKNIKRMQFYCKRKATGGYGSTKVTIRYHNYTSRPNGQPSVSNEYVYATFNRGDALWIDLPTTFFAPFQNGAAKGIALYTASGDDAYYAIFDDSAILKITYQ
ncbi:phage tail spike protein [Thermoactinomyces sp. CICC 10521]|uniref:phage tail spike protein n=1 Tax=Thermoactinomyces sp. CICC 10521 TaxID=2767426 RepID=UPI0018DBC0DE|nr:phage tail spike protein [Thermoactinomyces sp. CICC 10521]MBH8605985.1 phage tail protein [Thermoactinomyces sp. CICC 10521]